MGIFLRSDRERVFDQDFVTRAVKRVIEEGESTREVAKGLRIDRRTLRDWVNEYRERPRREAEEKARREQERARWESEQRYREWLENRGS